jgi:hypothetical protein
MIRLGPKFKLERVESQAKESFAKVQNNIMAEGGCATFIGIFVAPAPSPVIII